MARYVTVILVPLTVIVVCVTSGFSLPEACIVFLLGVLGLGFLGWMVVERFRSSFVRSLMFWWIAKILDQPELIYPE